jgi:hypothetical protein
MPFIVPARFMLGYIFPGLQTAGPQLMGEARFVQLGLLIVITLLYNVVHLVHVVTMNWFEVGRTCGRVSFS